MKKRDYWMSEEGISKIRAMVKSGMKHSEVCSAMNVCMATLKKWRRENEKIKEVFICKGHTDIQYEATLSKGGRQTVYRYYKNGWQVKYCRHCKEFVEIEKISVSGYCNSCQTERSKNYTRPKEVKEKRKLYYQKYYKENKEKIYEATYKRYSRMKGSVYSYSVQDWKDVLEYFNNECAYCGDKDGKLQREHVIPVSKNGGYVRTNIIPACVTCNTTKSAQLLEEWYPNYKSFSELRYEKIKKWIGEKEGIQQLTLL